MGIPFFFKYIFDNCGSVVHHLNGKLQLPIDHFFMDLNSLIHPVCQRFFPKKEENKFSKPKRLLHSKQEEKKIPISNKMIFSELCKEIEKRVFIIQPKKTIYIAIDGVAGISKGSQQRQRRALSVKSKSEEEIKEFDTNCISAGTQFMEELSRYLDYYFKGKISKNSYWKNLKIIFSNDKVVGEGEIKLINWIRINFDIFLRNKENIVIDSPDADLLMLAMGTHYPHIYVFRDNIYKNIDCKHFLVDISKLRHSLICEINNNDQSEKKDEKEEDNDLIIDFLFIEFFFGNDFFHSIGSIEMNKNNMDDILRIYFQARQIFPGRIIKSIDLTINVKFLKIFLNLLAKEEINLIHNKSKFGYVNPLLQRNTNENGIDLKQYREDYFKEKLFIDQKKDKDQYCNEYLKSLIFVLRYYLRGIPDYHFSFKYHYSPFFSDLYEYILNIKEDTIDFKFENNKPLSLYEQLVAILPVESKNLIPKQLHCLYEIDSDIYDFYPSNFKIDLDGKKDDYLGIVCLPFIDVKRLKEAYSKIDLKNLTEFERKRNYFGKVMIYEFDKEKNSVNRNFL